MGVNTEDENQSALQKRKNGVGLAFHVRLLFQFMKHNCYQAVMRCGKQLFFYLSYPACIQSLQI